MVNEPSPHQMTVAELKSLLAEVPDTTVVGFALPTFDVGGEIITHILNVTAEYRGGPMLLLRPHTEGGDQQVPSQLSFSSPQLLPIGAMVRVGESIGTIVGHPPTNEIPDEHYAVWFGETSSDDVPQCRTVPMEYCSPGVPIEYYH
ncbi:MAG: hypothetical protein KDA88_04200 [Planctomycetaceae bacterium]|nr:hypothetical protein [Planctomycetaceae bacterium]